MWVYLVVNLTPEAKTRCGTTPVAVFVCSYKTKTETTAVCALVGG